ncbi:formamidase (plasmid) [Deinococcus psychrotolerans]|uniref:Formamidase n=1 Tax=Deinococcus psychrotolerans TaxID=2489213 RepID=A0A3G8YIE0_9DEIO|nr:acetamidase/formamidase family protein [Deinococcus psychrotolerans]AZI45012.1 formamidase [Deinococcus psychrotolerans]
MSPSVPSRKHLLGTDSFHTVWSRDLAPALRVAPGDTITFQTLDASYGAVARQVAAGSLDCPEALRETVLQSVYPEQPATAGVRGHPLTGPVFIEGALPGDTVQIELLGIEVAAWGWNACRPGGIGLLDDEVPEAHTQFWDLSDGHSADFLGLARIPLAPFPGIVGVAPAEAGLHRTAPPRQVGGNMDIRQLTVGSTLYLPVEVEGALLSLGDVHAAQGDGEVSSTGIETDARVTLRVQVLKDRPIRTPHLRTGPEPTDLWSAGAYMTTGHAPDLREAARTALRELVVHLQREYSLTYVQAYVLCSACADLRISQIVDAPHFTVSALFPERIFGR